MTKKKLVERIQHLDDLVMVSVRAIRHPILTRAFRTFSYSGEARSWFGLAALIWALNYFRVHIVPGQREILHLALAGLLAWALGSVFKKLFNRMRPFQRRPEISALYAVPKNDSFPSNHAAAASALCAAAWATQHPLSALVAIWAAIVILSRLYLGVHYLSDLLAGILLGFFSAQLLRVAALY